MKLTFYVKVFVFVLTVLIGKSGGEGSSINEQTI